MLITFTQSGGFAGTIRGCRIDTDDLEDDERQILEELVKEAGWTESWHRFSEGRDRWQYDISIDRDAAVVHVSCDDSVQPASLTSSSRVCRSSS
ncbi:MAG: protealysin inhibitor emfourin, partial [Planctomycetia bacterium]